MDQHSKLRSLRLAQIQQKRTAAQLVQLLHLRAIDSRLSCNPHLPPVQSADRKRRYLKGHKRNKYPGAGNFKTEKRRLKKIVEQEHCQNRSKRSLPKTEARRHGHDNQQIKKTDCQQVDLDRKSTRLNSSHL